MKLEDLLNSLPSKDDIAAALSGQARNAGIDLPTTLGVFGAGVLLGAGLALLFAPKPGQELRHDLTEKLDEVRHKLDGRNGTSDRATADMNLSVGE